MIPKFKFLIDKEANFIYWAQLMIGKWCWYFQNENFEFFKNVVGSFSATEQDALSKFKLIIQKDGNQFLWLWKRYDKQSILNKIEAQGYQEIRSILSSKFELIWVQELPKLKNWQVHLESFKFQNLENIFYKIIRFLGNQDIINDINVKLMFGAIDPTGATRPDFKNLIILNISSIQTNKINSIIGILIHEFAHLINSKNKFLQPLFLKSFFRLIFLKNILHLKKIKLKNNYRWKYLFTETILRSIASHRSNNYLGEILDFSEEKRLKDRNIFYKKELREYSYEFIIRVVANHILPETKKYFKNNKIIDQAYVDKIANIWSNIFK